MRKPVRCLQQLSTATTLVQTIQRTEVTKFVKLVYDYDDICQ